MGSLELNIITGRALAKTKNVSGGQLRALGAAASPLLPAGYAHVACPIIRDEINET